VRALWRRAGVGHGVSRVQVAAFAAGLLVLVIALVSPLDALSLTLFSAHMLQHLLLIMVAAPLLIVGAPPVALAWMLPAQRPELARWWRRQSGLSAVWRAITHPVTVWALHVTAVWVWHMPFFYQAALTNEWIHWLEHASFFGTALLFWWVVAHCGRPGHLSVGAGVFYIFTMVFQGGLLGSLLTFAPTAWYAIYAATTPAWGLTPLEDQQLAGVLMWIPASLIYLAVALAMLGRWLSRLEQADRHRRTLQAARRYSEGAAQVYLPEGD
jgi:putative membrane protein